MPAATTMARPYALEISRRTRSLINELRDERPPADFSAAMLEMAVLLEQLADTIALAFGETEE